jgi:hypothetical protein
MNFYRLYTDNYFPDHWYLGDINVDDNWIFTDGKPVNVKKNKKLEVEVDEKGVETDFTETSAFIVPIISKRFAECLYEYTDQVQLLPVKVPSAKDSYYILVIKHEIDCVDESRSEFVKFKENDEIRPDLAGEYKEIHNLKIDKSKVDKSIFRLGKFGIYIIINEKLKTALEKENLTGFKLELVS